MSITLRDGFFNESLDRVLEDLLVRFVINCPDEDLSSIERVFFQIEEAQWFYADFIRQLNNALPNLKMKGFSTLMIERCPMIWRWGSASEALARFGKYKSTIPVRGAALLNSNMDKMLLVKGTESNSWGFPRGKISKDEEDVLCAIREVKEETGFDCSDLIDAANYLERTIKGKNFKIFFIDGVPEDYNFEPIARNEISEIAWKDIKYLNKSAKTNPNQFFLVSAMMKPITQYIAMKKGKGNQEEIKRRVANELKLLLGITSATEELPGEVDIDRGRDLLEKLKAAIKAKPALSEEKLVAPASLPLPPNVLPQFPPLMPYFAHNGLALPFSPNMIPLGQPLPPHFFPPPPMPLQHPQQQYLQPLQQAGSAYPQFAMAPTPESLHKPSFSLVNKRSKEADSKLLLGILNKSTSTNESLPVHSQSEERAFGDQELVNKSKSNFLMDLFNKNSVSSSQQIPLKKVSILKREPAAQPEPKKISILKRPQEEKSDGGSEQGKENKKIPEIKLLRKDETVSSNAGKDLMAMLSRSESHSRSTTPINANITSSEQKYHSVNSSVPNSDSNSSLVSNGVNESEFESYEDFEDFAELDDAASSEVEHNNLLEYDDSDDEYQSESSEEEIELKKSPLTLRISPVKNNNQNYNNDINNNNNNNHNHNHINNTNTNNNNGLQTEKSSANNEPITRKKIKILKRNDTPANVNGSDRATIEKPQNSTKESGETNGVHPLLSLLKNSNTASGVSTNNASSANDSKSLLSLLKGSNDASNSLPNDTSNVNNSKSLLSLLQTNSPNHIDEPQASFSNPTNEQSLLSLLQQNSANSAVERPAPTTTPSKDLSAFLSSGNSKSIASDSLSNGQSASAGLLSLLKKPPQSQPSNSQESNLNDPAILLTGGQSFQLFLQPQPSMASNLDSSFFQGLLNGNNSSTLGPQNSNGQIGIENSIQSNGIPPFSGQLQSPPTVDGRDELLSILRRNN